MKCYDEKADFYDRNDERISRVERLHSLTIYIEKAIQRFGTSELAGSWNNKTDKQIRDIEIKKKALYRWEERYNKLLKKY